LYSPLTYTLNNGRKLLVKKVETEKEKKTYTVPLLHAHGNLNKLVNISDNGTQPTVAVCDAG